MKIIIGVLLIVHGLIVALQSAGSFGSTPPNEIQNPSWVSWWPANMGRSWLLAQLGLDQFMITYRIGGLLWLAGGILLVAAGLGAMGLLIPTEWWRSLAATGGAVSLFMLVLYLHPLMILGTGMSLAIVAALLWAKWPSPALVP